MLTSLDESSAGRTTVLIGWACIDLPNFALARSVAMWCDTKRIQRPSPVSPFTASDDLDTLHQLDDTSRLAYPPLDRQACIRLRQQGLVSEEAGWWRITPLGRLALVAAALTVHGRKLNKS